jgi:hypothetical protein
MVSIFSCIFWPFEFPEDRFVAMGQNSCFTREGTERKLCVCGYQELFVILTTTLDGSDLCIESMSLSFLNIQ